MNMSLSNVTCNDERAYSRLINYLYRVSEYKNFDESMPMNIYVDSHGDLIGFDSQKYRIQFVNNAHKLKEISMSSFSIEPVTFAELKKHVLAIGTDMPF